VSNMPGYNPEGLGIQVGEALLEAEQKRLVERRAEIMKETDELVARLAHDLCLHPRDVPLVAMRLLAKLLCDGMVVSSAVADHRDVGWWP